ncbi:putative cytokinetic ring protein SteA [Aeromicrobium marinum]|nr:putative cytokinetic ring protein SteA [Aeromicrobium marinum]
MSLFTKSRPAASDDGKPGITGPARLVRPGGDLTAGLRPGDIAVIDRVDLQQSDAERLIQAKVAAVVNLAVSASGRFPNLGPQLLAEHDIALVDQVGQGLVARVRSGDHLRIHEGKIFRDGVLVASGIAQDSQRARADLSAASTDLSTQLDILAVNAADHLRREHAMLLEGVRIPRVSTRLKDRPAVVVSDGFDAAADLAGLRRFILDRDPVLIGAGGGADVILKAGYAPTIVVGGVDALSSAALRSAREVVVTTASGRIENPERLEKHGPDVVRFVASGADTDLAILLADANHAAIIVHAGAPPTLVDFLEQGSGLIGPAFVVRLRAAAKIMDAKAVHHLTTGRISWWPVALLLLAGLVAVGVAIGTTSAGSDLYSTLGDRLSDLTSALEGLLP